MSELTLGRRASFFKVIATCIAAMALLFATASAAHAEEHHFCWGANLAPGAGCQSGLWYMTGGYANSSDGVVCLYMSGPQLAACDHAPNEGIYVAGYGYRGQASIFHNNNYTIKVYGVFWT